MYFCRMFLEPYNSDKIGWIEVVCGSMFSGKTEELLRRIKRAQIANLKIEIYKPEVDTRYDVQEVVSHDYNRIPSTPISHSNTILLLTAEDTDVIAIDEVQFMDDEIVHVAEALALRGKRVIVAGLDMDFRGEPFGPIAALLAKADYITKLHAICVVCGNIANYSYRKIASEETLLLGEKESYEPRCRKCYHL